MRVTLIHNPGAGDDKQPTAGQLEVLIEEAGHKVRYESTKEKGWAKALKKETDLVVVAGGDGTVGKVARRLIGEKLPIAILPMGTANNISRTLGISNQSVTQLIPSWASARRLSFDAGIATGPWGERYFIEGVGAGLMVSSIPEVDENKTVEQLTDAGVKVTYAQQIFREHLEECPAIDIEGECDGKDMSGRYLLMELLNMAYIGPNLFLAPDIVRNDGELDLVLLAEKHRKKLQDHIKDWQEGKPWPPEFGARRCKRLKIEWTGFKLHIDDKIWPGDDEKKKPKPPATIDIKVEPKAITFLVPKEVEKENPLLEEGGRKNGKKKKVKA